MKRAIELWKPVMEIGEGNRFEVSSRGRVRDLVTGKPHKPACTRGGFLVVRARYGDERKNVTLHRLVALAFLPGEPTYPVIFKDGKRSRCAVSNLRWATEADKRTPHRKLTDEDVRYIREQWPAATQRELAEELDVCRQTISEVVTRKTWVGPQWEPGGVEVLPSAKERNPSRKAM